MILAFVVGRWTVAAPDVGSAPGQRGGAPASAPTGARDRPPASVATLFAGTVLAAQAAAAAQVPSASPEAAESAGEETRAQLRRPLAPEVEARVHEEARAGLERLRQQVVERCWPRDGLPGGRRQTTVTYNVTFDPTGREIARGILDDRRSPAGAFGGCLRRLEGTSLSVSPTGSYVTLRLPVTYGSGSP